MSSSRIFRKVSLDRLSSPEQLDQVMQVTTPKGWLALAAVGGLLLTAIVWGCVGQLDDKVAGRGILVKSGGVLEVVTTATGRVSDVAVAVGDSVTEGQVVAWVAQPELFEQLQQAKADLATVTSEHEQAVEFAHNDMVLQRRSLVQQRANLEQSIAATSENLRRQAERIRAQERLVEEKLMTRTSLLQTQQQYEQTQEKLRASRAELTQLSVRQLELDNRLAETTRGGERRIEQMEREIATLERDLKAASQIVSPYTGRILEVMTEQGKVVSRGEPVLTLDLTGQAVQELMGVLYVPSIHGKKIRPGMQIQIAPSTVRQEEYGMMLGRVTFVSSFPATPKGMARVLKNEQLVMELSGGDAPYEVHAELIVDPSTESQYKWSSSKGPPTRVQSGTLATGSVTVDSQRPIAIVIPLLRKWTGI